MLSPAQKLVGLQLTNDWKVTDRISKDPNHTGGYFSVGYVVRSAGGERAFLKALDFQKALLPGVADPVKRISEFTSGFVYERDLLRQCRQNNLKRIIRSLGDGDVVVDGVQVPYIIFEFADSDIRHQSNRFYDFELAWVLRTMHHVATGIMQLHGSGIAHQDLKPSNILVVNGDERKIGDLGRSATKGCKLSHVSSIVAGDRNHAPPEGLYGYVHPDWRERRYGCDAYQLGSLLVFMLTGLSATTLLLESLKQEYRPGIWGGQYGDVLPYLIDAYESVVSYVAAQIPESNAKSEITLIMKHLCHPDIDQRGDPVKRGMGANPFAMERFISKFDRLATAIERRLIN